MEIDVTSPRPLAEAALLLEKRISRPVTYEEAPYLHPDDMTQDEAGRIIPRGGRISIQYATNDDPRAVIAQCLEAQTHLGYPGVYAVEEHYMYYHIVPRGFRNPEGILQERLPLLDTVISLPSQTRNGLQFVEDITRALTAITGETVSLGTIPTNAFVQHQSTSNTSHGKARDLLVDLFREMGKRFSWQLLNNPGSKKFFLNIYPVPD